MLFTGKKNKRRALMLFIFIVLVIAGFIVWPAFSPRALKIKKPAFLYIPTGAVFANVLDSLESKMLLSHPRTFRVLSGYLRYPENIKAGKYKLEPGMSNLAIIRLLRSGKQTPVNLVIVKERSIESLAGLIASKLEPSAGEMQALFKDSTYLSRYGLDTNTAMSVVIPNTYQFFWNSSDTSIFQRLREENEKFWTPGRKEEAQKLGMTPVQAYTLASIVEEESNKLRDQPVIASVYLNRMGKGIRLQADPTIKFALNDFSIRRITGKMLETPSLYNTYLYKGLPPGPICTPAIKTIDAVLSAPQTPYLYFCAKPDLSGYHNFASTYAEHLKNARAYHQALNKLKIE